METPDGSEVRCSRVKTVTVNVCLFSNIPLQRPEGREMKAKAKVKVMQVISLDFGVCASVKAAIAPVCDLCERRLAESEPL